jgi:hypothetical protein
MTLSHCWGKQPLITLSVSNIDTLMNGISIMSFPATFTQAIEITRRFGVRYLWIDSLCIIQDSPGMKDWLTEASLMQRVYSHSQLNIAATASRSGKEGLFRKRNLEYYLPKIIHATWDKGGNRTLDSETGDVATSSTNDEEISELSGERDEAASEDGDEASEDEDDEEDDEEGDEVLSSSTLGQLARKMNLEHSRKSYLLNIISGVLQNYQVGPSRIRDPEYFPAWYTDLERESVCKEDDNEVDEVLSAITLRRRVIEGNLEHSRKIIAYKTKLTVLREAFLKVLQESILKEDSNEEDEGNDEEDKKNDERIVLLEVLREVLRESLRKEDRNEEDKKNDERAVLREALLDVLLKVLLKSVREEDSNEEDSNEEDSDEEDSNEEDSDEYSNEEDEGNDEEDKKNDEWVDLREVLREALRKFLPEVFTESLLKVFRERVRREDSNEDDEGNDGENKKNDEEVVPFLMYEDLWFHQVNNAPLNCRAWVLQERFLAPRVLQFGERQLFWECRQNSACEIFPRRLPSELSSMIESNVKRLDRFAKDDGDPTSGAEARSTIYLWQRLVEVYSQCQMTNLGDKLIAINGIADTIKDKTGNTYLAGLWKPSLPLDLLWCVIGCSQGNGESSHHPRLYRAPTWSWASIEGQVHFDSLRNPESKIQIEILEAEVTPLRAGINVGQVVDGFICLRGEIFGPMTLGESVFPFVFKLSISNKEIDFCIPDIPSTESVSDLYCLPIIDCEDAWDTIWVDAGIDEEQFYTQRGLVIRSAPDQPQGYYERFGYLRTHNSALSESYLAPDTAYCEDDPDSIVLV